uniref:Uncharacterized protein LOC109687735 n=1 Tax=Castor canadensis TaxID=51338 RepID=A0A8B7UNW7_CASCN|nr:uncharacterized protein LOC109687735 [Castor canadensis]
MCHRGFRGPNRGRRVQYLVEGTCPALLSRAPGPTPAATPTGGDPLEHPPRATKTSRLVQQPTGRRATPRRSQLVLRQCAGARAPQRMSSAPASPPATVSGASYAAVAVTMAHYKAADSKREQFRRYLEKSGVLDTLTKGERGLGEGSSCPQRALCTALLAGCDAGKKGEQVGPARGPARWASRCGEPRRRARPLSPRGVKLLQLLQSLSNFRCFALSSRRRRVCYRPWDPNSSRRKFSRSSES